MLAGVAKVPVERLVEGVQLTRILGSVLSKPGPEMGGSLDDGGAQNSAEALRVGLGGRSSPSAVGETPPEAGMRPWWMVAAPKAAASQEGRAKSREVPVEE